MSRGSGVPFVQLFQATRHPSTWPSRDARSVLDDSGQHRGHATLADRADRDFAGAARRLQHLSVAQVDGDVLAATRAVEDEVAAPRLRRRNVPTGLPLVTGEPRDQHPDAGEAVPDQARGVDALAGAVECAAAPRVRHTHLRGSATDHVFDRLTPVGPRDLAGADAATV